MTAKLLFIIIVFYLEKSSSQFYGQTATYQPYNYYPTAPKPMPSSMATSPYPYWHPPPPVLPPPTPYSTNPSFTTSPTTAAPKPTANYAPQMYVPMPYAHTPTYQQSPYAAPAPFNFATPPKQTYVPVAVISPGPYPTTGLNKATSTATPKATAYYLTTLETPNTAVMKQQVKENLKEKLPAPTYPCPFCTGFKNVPKNSKVPPPPTSALVLPGILDKIPTISVPDELKIKEIGKKLTSAPSLSDLFEHKLSGKLRFDQDLLDGFLTGLGLGNCDD